jgi:hypothetical protein
MMPKPHAATSEQWQSWKANAKAANKTMFWIVEELLDSAQSAFFLPHNAYKSVKIYIRNRFISKTHVLQTKLSPGLWHEVDTRILHGLFETLVNFVEVEKASMQRTTNYFNKESSKGFTSKELGLQYLAWETSLLNEDGSKTFQAIAAEETIRLYTWWTEKRLKRKDPYAYKVDYNIQDIIASSKLEELEEQEDTDNLIALIKIRTSLWT